MFRIIQLAYLMMPIYLGNMDTVLRKPLARLKSAHESSLLGDHKSDKE